MQEIIDKLRDDEHYYGEFGKQFLSNSDIKNLIEHPANFKQGESTLDMLKGQYVHTAMLQPHKLGDFHIVDASTRNTKIYKDASDIFGAGEMLLLQHEVDELNIVIDKAKSNKEIKELLYRDGTVYEEPGIKMIHGKMWKAKADAINDFIIDVKTTGDINSFDKSVYVYNYDSQSFIYEEVFGKPFIFIVLCKKTHQIGIFEVSPETKARGEEKVLDAIIQYDRFYGDEATEDPNNFVIKRTI